MTRPEAFPIKANDFSSKWMAGRRVSISNSSSGGRNGLDDCFGLTATSLRAESCMSVMQTVPGNFPR